MSVGYPKGYKRPSRDPEEILDYFHVLRIANEKLALEEILELLNNPQNFFSRDREPRRQ
jgi:hypothetical protein